MNWKSIMVGVITMLIGLAVWELFVKKMVVQNSLESYYEGDEDCGCGGYTLKEAV